MGRLDILLMGVWLGVASRAAAGSALDTTYCSPTVIVREAVTGVPVSASIAVYPIVSDAGASPQVVADERKVRAAADGLGEIKALPPGRYLVGVLGSIGERPLKRWHPPRGPRPNIDLWQRRTQVHQFERWSEWHVVHGHCADSLVLRVRPTRWVTVIRGEWRLIRFEPPRRYGRLAGSVSLNGQLRSSRRVRPQTSSRHP